MNLVESSAQYLIWATFRGLSRVKTHVNFNVSFKCETLEGERLPFRVNSYVKVKVFFVFVSLSMVMAHERCVFIA